MPRWRWLSLTMMLGLVLAACGGPPAASPSPDDEEPTETVDAETPDESPAESPGEMAELLAYPEDGPVPCPGAEEEEEEPAASPDESPAEAEEAEEEYTGNFSYIEATDERTVVFTLCSPDVAFLSKIAFAAFAINDTEHLESAAPDGSIVENPNGTGPYRLGEWIRGDSLVFEANPDYWGEPAVTPNLVFRWSPESAQRLVELQSGQVSGIDNPGPDDFAAIEADPNLVLLEREGLNTFYVGMNNFHEPWDNDLVRQAMAVGIDRQRIVDTFYPRGSEVASHFTPCAIEFGCEGEEWPEFDPDLARELLAEAGFPDGFETTIAYRDVVRTYLPTPGLVAQDLQDQLADLGITAQIDLQESGTFITNSDEGNLTGLYLLGWGADYPDATNFLDFHFGIGASDQFGEKWDDITEALATGGSSIEDAERATAYEEANNAIREHVPMVPIAHGGSAAAYQASVTDPHASPLGNEYFAAMGADGDTFVWMQNAEPLGLYCADETDGETLRACEQIMEPLYGYELAGTAAEPLLAEECAPNDELTEWTCTLREGVTFHDGATLDANDVVLSYAVQWDAEHPLHVGRDNLFSYFSGLFGGFLNPPPAEE